MHCSIVLLVIDVNVFILDVVRHGWARRMHDDESDVEVCRQVGVSPESHLSPERRGSAALCSCHDERPRWPRTCLMSANQLSRSLSGRSYVAASLLGCSNDFS